MERKITVLGFIQITFKENVEQIYEVNSLRYRIYLWGIKIYDNKAILKYS